MKNDMVPGTAFNSNNGQWSIVRPTWHAVPPTDIPAVTAKFPVADTFFQPHLPRNIRQPEDLIR